MTSNEEAIKKMRKKQIANSKKSLEKIVYQKVTGANQLKSNPFEYGQLGLSAGEKTYKEFHDDVEIKKIKDEIYKEKLEHGKALGVYGEPIYPTNYDVSIKIAEQVEEHKTLVPLKILEEIVKNLAKDFDFRFSVPEQLKEMSAVEILMKKQRGAKLTEQENDALSVYKILSDSYNRAVALKIGKRGYFADINAFSEQLAQKYKKPEKQKGE